MSKIYTFKVPASESHNAVDDFTTKPSQILRGTLRHSTAHGFRNSVKARGSVKNYFWACAIFLITNAFVVHMIISIKAYFAYDVQVAVEFVHSNTQPFPAVTVCNMNPMKASSVENNELLNEILGRKRRKRKRKRRGVKVYEGFGCPDSPALQALDPDTGLCYYKLHSSNATILGNFTQITELCKTSVGNLGGGNAIIDSQDKLDFINNAGIFSPFNSFWVNVWGDTMEDLAYNGSISLKTWAHWQPLHPVASSNTSCVAAGSTQGHQWYSEKCGQEHMGLCVKKSTCPNPIDTISGKCFFLWDRAAKYTWEEAGSICELNGAKQATLDTPAMVEHVKNHVDFTGAFTDYYWVAMHQAEVNGSYTWKTNEGEIPHNVSNWEPPSPLLKGPVSYCVAGRIGGGHLWHSFSCDTNVLVLCEWADCNVNHGCIHGSCYHPDNGVVACKCDPGWTGTKCEINIDECESNPCQNGATCTDNIDGFSCECTQGYTGTQCQEEINECNSNPCIAGDICIDHIDWYECICEPGSTDGFCHTELACANSPGFEFIEPRTGLCYFKLHTPHKITKDKYRQFIHLCEDSAGSSGGSLAFFDSQDKIDIITNAGIFGSGEVYWVNLWGDTDESIGYNGSIILNTWSHWNPAYPSTAGSQFCVTANPDENHQWSSEVCDKDHYGLCVKKSICPNPVDPSSHKCFFLWDKLSKYTYKEATEICQLHGTKLATLTTQATVDHVKHNVDFTGALSDYYWVSMHQDKANGTYIWPTIEGEITNELNNWGSDSPLKSGLDPYCVAGRIGGDHSWHSFSCQSDVLVLCEWVHCNFSHPCLHGNCYHPEPGVMACSCDSGWTGSVCEIDMNECNSNPCTNGAICKEGINDYTCACLPGFTGINCETDVDECGPYPCLNGATCIDLLNNYKCQCATGFTGNDCETNIDDCASQPCQNSGTCLDSVDFYSCTCVDGFTRFDCQTNINECLSSPCMNAGLCIDDINGYHCNCTEGWDGNHCQNNIDECGIDSCYNGGTCIDGIAGYNCSCVPGYVGERCQNETNECFSNPCYNGGECVDEINGYTCNCPGGYNGIHCGTDIEECESNPCHNEAVCLDIVDGYHCQCRDGFNGTHCEDELDECLSNPCNHGAVCIDDVNGYHCQCSKGYNGTYCEIDIDECASNPCQNRATCMDHIDAYFCKCPAGYNGTQCQIDVDECLSVPCQNGGNCTDLENEFNCTCIPGFNGTHCEQDIDECSSEPCFNGGTCLDEVNHFRCTCDILFTGETCQTEIPVTTIQTTDILTTTAAPTTEIYTTSPPVTGPKLVEGSSIEGRVAQRESFVKEEKVFEVLANMDLQMKADLGYHKSELILDCEFRGVPCNMSLISYFYNPYHGNCYIYNSGWGRDNVPKLADNKGRNVALKMVINIGQDEYTDEMGDAAGAKILILPQNRMPFPEDEGLMVRTGFLTSIGLEKVSVKRLSKPYGNCSEIDPEGQDVYADQYPVKYSAMGCYKTCFQKHLMKECGCADPNIPMTGGSLSGLNVSACERNNIVQDDCLYLMNDKYATNQLPCECKVPCRNEIYLTEVSKAVWPSERSKTSTLSRLGDIGKDMLKSHKFKENLMKVEIYFKELSYQHISEVPSYSDSEFASDLGGVISLWIGASGISFMEWFENGLDMMILGIMKLREKLRKKTVVSNYTQEPEEQGGEKEEGEEEDEDEEGWDEDVWEVEEDEEEEEEI